MLTDQELNEIEARANACTEGPWELEVDEGNISHVDGGLVAIVAPYAYIPNAMREGCAYHKATGIFLAASRQDITTLITEVRRLRELLKTS